MKKAKVFITLLLCAAMLLSLSACGGKNEDVQEETPEFVYASSYQTLVENSKNYINPTAFVDGGFYSTVYEKVGEDIPEGVTPEYEGQYDVYEYRIYFTDNNGKATLLEGYEPLPRKENTEGYKEFYSGSDVSVLRVNNQGQLVLIESAYSNWFEGDAEPGTDEYWNSYKYTQEYYIRVLDKDGSEISRGLIPTNEGEYIYAYYAQVDAEGNMLIGLDMGGLKAIAPDGSTAYSISDDVWVDNIVKLGDDTLAAVSWGENGMELLPIDMESKSFGEPMPIPDNAYNFYTGGGEYDFYYTSGIVFYGYDMETQQSTELFNWINCDVNGDDLSGIHVTDDGKVIGYTNEWDNDTETYTCEIVTVEKVPYDSVPHKESLKLACMYLDWEVRNMIIDFNRHNDKYRIDVVDYSQYNTEEDYSAGLTKLNTEIMAGNMPDIIALSELPYTQLAAKGLLADLYKLMENDKEINREDYFENVLAALEVNGGLYSTCPGFQISSVMGAASVVGDEPGWTYDEFNAALASMPEGCTAFDIYTTRGDILRNCLALDMEQFVDWSSGKVSFDSPAFIQLLEFAKSFPSEFDWENYQWSEDDDAMQRIAQGKQMLMHSSIFSIDDLKYNDFYFGGDSTYIGYPTSSGTGNMLDLSSGYAISEKCEHKEAAWQFVREFFTEDYQESQWRLPSHKGVFEAKLKDAMTVKYRTDAEGNYLLDENGNKIEETYGVMVDATGNEYRVGALTQAQADKLRMLIATTTKAADYSSSIFDIVNEQAAAYFEGQKSAEEVAKLIQSKANIYVNEQR